MPRPKIIRRWIELSETFLVAKDEPDDQEINLFTNHCELRETKKGNLLIRSVGITTLTATSKDELEKKLADFAMREDVRRLVKGVESNDCHTLPREQLNPPQEIIDGTDDVYLVESEEPCGSATN